MSKRKRVPGPFFRNMPSVIRTSLPRFVFIAATACALLVIGGGSYVISHVTPKPRQSTQKPPVGSPATEPAAQAEVLGDATAGDSTAESPAAAPVADITPTPSGTTSPTTNNPTPQAATNTKVQASTTPKKTEVHVDTPVGSLLLNLPIGI
jgi:hypothetical protein